MHWLQNHVVPFVKEFKTWGKISDTALESLHAQFNRLEKRFISLDRIIPIYSVLNALFDRSFELEDTSSDMIEDFINS